MLAVTTLPPLIWPDPPAIDQVDALASAFLRQESETAEAYAAAIRLDEKLEVMRERLILCVEQFGIVNGEHKLAGTRFTIVLRHPTATVLDQALVQWFQLAHPELFPKIFAVHLNWSLAPGADETVAALPSNVRTMFEKCLVRRADPPVLEVRSR